jgi:uncharacterized protein (DUF983 family)
MNDSGSGETGFVGSLTILFIGLKLTGFIKWSWLWVLSPLWMSFLLVLLITMLIILSAVLTNLIKERK